MNLVINPVILLIYFFLLLAILNRFLICTAKLNKKDVSPVSFLETYGYLPEMSGNELNLLSHERLEHAIKLMQKFAHIPQTGKIDNQTLAAMKRPRCGLPDIERDERSGRHRSKRFAVSKTKWKKSPILWSFVSPSRTVPNATAREAFTRAWDMWTKSTNTLRFVETSGPKADVLIGFYTGDHGCGSRQAFDGRGIKLAHAFAPPKGDVHFDDDEDWVSGKDGLNLFWTAVHEFGHSLGFRHTAEESSIMFPYYLDRKDDYELPEVDKARMRYLYGNMKMQTSRDRLPSFTTIVPERNRYHTTTESPSLSPRVEDLICNTNFDAIASIRSEIFAFKNKSFWWIKNDLELVRRDPIPITQYFIGFPPEINHIDAVYERRSDRMIMFFVGKNYYLFNTNRFHSGPIPLTNLGLPEQIDKIDAITDWSRNGRAYIFTGPVYWRMDAKEEHVEADYPRDMHVWKGVPFPLDDAFTWPFDSATYFLKGKSYWKFNNERMKVTEEGKIKDFLFRSIPCRKKPEAQGLVQMENDQFQGRSSSLDLHKFNSFNLIVIMFLITHTYLYLIVK